MNTYTQTIHDLTPAQIWAAWKAQEITADQLSTWQQQNNYYFNDHGGQILARRIFHRLERDTFTRGRYIVLNDGNFYAGFYAESDAAAIEIFDRGEYLK